MTALLPENVGCPQCGSTDGKRWRSYSGVELCTDCEWDYFAELNGRKFLDAQQARQTKILPSASVTAEPIRHKSPGTKPAKRTSVRLGAGGVDALGKVLVSRSRPQDDIRCRVPMSKWRETCEKLLTPGFNSLCLLCSHIFYGAKLEQCSRCGGLTQQVSDHDLGLMGRHGQRLVEQER